jgi:predicted double-glycine peptidase
MILNKLRASIALLAGNLCLSAIVASPVPGTAATPSNTSGNQAPAELITSYPTENLVRVPLTRQATDYTCGVAALQSVLAYYGDDEREGVLAKACKASTVSGTRYSRMAQYAKSKGYQVAVKMDSTLEELQALLDQKLPVICLIQAWPGREVDFTNDWDDGHYVVAIGYDKDNVYFMDPSTIGNYTFIPKPEFLKRWHDCESKTKKYNHFTMVINKAKPAFDPGTIKKLG